MEENFTSLEHFLGYSFWYIKWIIKNDWLSDKEKITDINSFIDKYAKDILWEDFDNI